jgi:transcriptional regulator with PAS, ATPase and Fis domain
MIGLNFLNTKQIPQALTQFQKVEEYYQKYGNDMDKRYYFHALICSGYGYIYSNNLEKVRQLVETKLSPNLLPDNFAVAIYYQLKGEYLKALKEYEQARQSFKECIKSSEKLNYIPAVALDAKYNFAVINLLEGRLEAAIQDLDFLLKDAHQLKLNDFIFGANLLLSKCYSLKNMPDKAASIEKRIKPLLNKLDITWLYEHTREIEQLYRELQDIYKLPQSEITQIPLILANTLNQHYKDLSDKNIIIGQSRPMQEFYQLVDKIAPTDLPVLIQGETGTGKELIANAIHNNSPRKEKHWLALNCGAIPETLLENELFGHNKGSFTDAREDRQGYIELASGGTLFMDEISEMSSSMQQKLLRVLEEKLVWRVGAQKPIPVNTRFIFASNQDIEELVKANKFREDLYYRINTIVITLPPLRDRKDDIPLLVTHFLTKYSSDKTHNAQRTTPDTGFSPDALALLQGYPWPGNVRELENEIKRICALYRHSKIITEEMVSESIKNNLRENSSLSINKLNIKERRKVFERDTIKEVLKGCNGNIKQAINLLGYSKANLYKKIKQLNIKLSDYSSTHVTKR